MTVAFFDPSRASGLDFGFLRALLGLGRVLLAGGLLARGGRFRRALCAPVRSRSQSLDGLPDPADRGLAVREFPHRFQVVEAGGPGKSVPDLGQPAGRPVGRQLRQFLLVRECLRPESLRVLCGFRRGVRDDVVLAVNRECRHDLVSVAASAATRLITPFARKSKSRTQSSRRSPVNYGASGTYWVKLANGYSGGPSAAASFGTSLPGSRRPGRPRRCIGQDHHATHSAGIFRGHVEKETRHLELSARAGWT